VFSCEGREESGLSCISVQAQYVVNASEVPSKIKQSDLMTTF